MKLSPLQLDAYALLDLSYRANQEHKPGQPVSFAESDLEVTTTCQRDAKDEQRWALTLTVRLQPRAEANTPYYFSLQLAGVIRTLPQLETDDPALLVKVNGASLLYGVARELVRQVTSAGPFPPMLLPSVTFRPEPTPATATPTLTAPR